VLLLHGEQDRVTPVTDSHALAEALGDRAQLIVFPEEGHTLRSPDVQRQILELEFDFLSRVVRDR
jgi:dipeptidyl aminopeptidase/acylaminoacyl peptidase